MPRKAKRPCLAPGCALLTDDGNFCAEHARARLAAYDERRGSSAERGYGGRWQRLRAMWLRSHPLCVDPFGDHDGKIVPATEVDHITPKSRGGLDAEDNLQSLCKACHSKKTSTVDRSHQRGG